MTTTPVESPMTGRTTLCDKASDLWHQATHVSHEAHVLKTVAADAVEDGVHAATRTIKNARQQALDARDELTFRVKRDPLKAVALVLGVGAVLGLAFGWACRRADG